MGGVVVLLGGLIAILWPGGAKHSIVGGPCSPDASLLGISDQLDKQPFDGTTIGGLSALAMIGDNRALTLADNSPPFLYDLRLGGDAEPTVSVQKVIPLVHKDGSPFGNKEIDGEGLVVQHGSVLVSSETQPSIVRFSYPGGREMETLPLPPRFRLIGHGGGADPDHSLEGLAASIDGLTVYAGMEAPLAADGSYQGSGNLRILRYTGVAGGEYKPSAQYAYRADADLSLAELATLDDGRLLVLERGYVSNFGNTIRVYQVSLNGAQDVSKTASLRDAPGSVFLQKHLLLDLGDCPAAGVTPAHQRQPNPLLDNVEGMALGPALPNGRRILYMITDDNLQPAQVTRLYKLSIRVRN